MHHCKKCGAIFVRTGNAQKYCQDCAVVSQRTSSRDYMRRVRGLHPLVCSDCKSKLKKENFAWKADGTRKNARCFECRARVLREIRGRGFTQTKSYPKPGIVYRGKEMFFERDKMNHSNWIYDYTIVPRKDGGES